jgi:hypothetical protein
MGKKDKKKKNDAFEQQQDCIAAPAEFLQTLQPMQPAPTNALEQQLRLLEQQNEGLRQELAKTQEAFELQAAAQVKKTPKIKVSYTLMSNNCPVPVAKPADFIQLTPIVQPIPLVPYSTQNQPLAHIEDYDDYN